MGIIGAGLAGLTCAFRLKQREVNSIIFEKEVGVGGRIPYSGAIATKNFQPRLISLIKELDLEELTIPLIKKEIGFILPDGEFLGMESLPMVSMKKFGLGGMLYFAKLTQFVNSARFDVANPDPKLVKLREISFEEYLKECPEVVRKFAVEPMMIFTYEDGLSRISADFGITHLRFGNELGSGKAFLFEENNIMTVTNVLDSKLKEEKIKILTSAEVKKIEKREGKFAVVYENNGQEKTQMVDKVVCTTPLNVTAAIFPELKLDHGIKYRDSKCVFVEGKLRWPERKFVIGFPKNPANLRAVFNVLPYAHLVYPADQEKPIDLDKLYSEHKITHEKELTPAMPIIGPKAKVPQLTTTVDGAYLCGDFHYYPWLETSVTTAELVANLITQS